MKIKILIIVAFVLTMVVPNSSFAIYQNPTAPTIGSINKFLLFTSAGNFTNTGLTNLYSGNVGTNLGSINGFETLQTQPYGFFNSTSETAQCALDLAALYKELTLRTADAQTDGNYGGSITTLTPGIYNTVGAITVTGNLTLDGQGNPDARFIIRSVGAFTSGATSKIILTNGTQAKNVFWVINGAIAIGANVDAKGIFINNAAISLGASDTLEGSILTTNGSISTLDGMSLTALTDVRNSMVLTSSQTIASGTLPSNLVVTGNTTPITKWQSSLTANFNIPTDIVNTSTTLISASIGFLALTKYYRAVMTASGLINRESNAVKITTTATTIAPNLGPTASFVLFTSEGPVTGAGAIPFTGNIGTNLGTIAGFTNLSDPLFHTQDALTAACANYLPELFSTLKAIPSTANHTAAFADGEIITPGVYQIPIASTMAGTITLDGGGNPNAVFIFKIPGALALTAATNIKLTNGTAASNVFWVMDGAFAAGANSVLVGTFICEAGIVGIGTGCTLNGHIFNISGAVTVTNSKLTLTNAMVLGASQSIAPGTLPANLVVTGNTTPIIKWQSSLTANFNIATDIANTTNTLTGAAIGILPLSTYYRAVMTLDGADTGSNAAKITITTATIAPNLGPTASFVLFTSAGPVTGTGAIPFTGNIGTNLGVIAGFSNLSDPLFHTQDALTASCANYLPELFSTLKAIPSTANHTAAFADGEIITPGVYQIPIASTMAGTITLNGGGDANAVFIFKIPGALALTAATNIKLTNGAAASNVFWIMDGAFAAGANSVLAGTFICEAGIVGIGTGCTLNGHIFNISGAVTVTNSKLTLTNAMVLGASQSIAPGTLPANLVVTGNTTPIIKWQSSLTANFTIPTDIANTTNTLTGAAIGILPLSTYYRAVMTLDGANTGSNAAKITITTATIAPNLGPTASFVLFTSEGPVTGAGAIPFTGNIGTNLGVIAGFTNLSDPLLHTQDALTAGCANYLPELFSTLKAIPSTANHTAAFADGEILVPGVYQIPIASTMAGTITLDGGGNPNAVFIFKIPGALALTAATNIKLTNGTAASNVFWVMDGAFAAGANSVLAGTFICEAGIVGIGTGCTLSGHIFNISGAVTVTNSKLTLTNAMVLGASQSIAPGTLPANLVVTGNTTPIIKWQSSLTANFNIPTDIANTTNTLTGAAIGILPLSTYYRAVMTLDGANTGSNAAKITITTPTIAPNLGPTASFVLFTSEGPVTGAGAIPFTGNIGTNLGVIAGFTNLSDPLLHTQDALTAGCANYLPELFSTLKAIPTTSPHVAAFSDGEIITPGVYQIPIASTMAGTITLDGTGDPNAVFIFKIPGALALTAGTTIKIINGAAASNVFWIMDGAFAAGANSALVGTFICEAGIVGIGTGCTLSGHIFNISGAVTVTNSKLTLTNAMVLGASQSIAPGTLPANLVVTGNTTPIIKWQSSLTANFNITTDIANTTNTLTGAVIGILPLSTYYRAVMTLDGANTGSNAAKITITTPTIAPNLGPTGSFVLFTSAGIITSAGGGTFTGNIGTNLGSITGFTNLSDPLFHTQDALTAACANYLPELFGTLKALPTTISTHPAAFVDGEILVPGVYQIPIASTLAGVVTLDGGGNPNAVFIFKIPGALALTAASEIKLINGTAASNVFWVMDGALAAGASSKLAGTFICEAGIVGIGTGCTINGHVFTLAGAITVTNTKLTLTNAMLLSASQSIAVGNLPADLVITGNISPVIKWQSSLTADFNNPTDIAHYSTTLSGSCIGFLDISTYFRALIVIDGAVTSSNYVKLTVATASIAPNLGPAASFLLFTSSGAIANAGTSTFTGNIGTNAGIISGFANLADPKLRTQDNLTASCANYVLEIFNNIKAIPTTNTSHAAAFVDGEILIPGIYQIAIASTLAGTLTLDGGGNSNAVFVFKINGAFALAAAAQIKLINGASASNVFWNINGALSAGAGAILKGIFICENGIISLGANCTLEGHAYTNFGAVTLSNSVLTAAVITNSAVVAANQSVVSGAIPANLVVTGNTTSIVRWEKSSDVLFTSPIAIANTTTILTGAEIGAITTNTYFRAVLAGIPPSYSTSVAITIAQITIPGTITANQNIVSGDFPANITISGNNGPVSKWQKSITADFVNPIDISSNSNFLSGLEIGTPSETIYIRAVVQNCICAVAYTNTVTITVYDGAINSLVLTANQSIESGIIPADLVLTGNTTPVIRWEGATNSAFVNPTTIAHFSNTLSGNCIGALTTTTYFRAVVETSGVNEYSNKITITVKAPVVPVASVVGPDLGVFAQFALFTSAGAITEGGTSTTSIGKIGTAFGLLNAFPSSLSSILHQQDPLTITCRDYLPTLFNRIKAYPTTSEHPNPAFGAGEILTPGVYHCFMAATMSGTLTLDAQNDQNAIFIFKITGALALAANTQMVLTNGAKSTNVFFAVDGALALGANCIFKGTSITYAGAVALGDSCIIDGRVSTIAGAITLANCQFTLDTVTPAPAPVIIPIINPVTASISIPGTISASQSYCIPTVPADITITGNNGPITTWHKSSDLAFTNPTYIIPNGTTLTGTVMGSLSTTTYFRAEVQNCTNAVSYTNVITISIIPVPIGGTVAENQQFNSPNIPLSLNLLNSVGTILKWQKSENINFIGLTTIDIPNTTARLDFTLPILTTTYYRAQLQGCNLETVFSDSAVVSIATTTTWTVNSGGIGSWSNGIPTVYNSAIIAGDYAEPANITTQNLTINNGSKVIIAAGINLILNGALTVTAPATFTLQSNANLVQTFSAANAANSGIITVRRESAPLYRSDYSLWCSPVTGQNVRNFSPATLINRFYFYNSAAATNGDYAALFDNADFPDPNPATYNFELAKGYYIRSPNTYANYVPTAVVPGVKFLGEFTGTPNNGTITGGLFFGLNGFYLTGNPYPSGLNLVPFFADNQSSIEGTIWLFRKINNLGTTNAYATMNTVGITSVQPGVTAMYTGSILNTGQGFFVKTKAGAEKAGLIFNNAMRTVTNLDPFFKSTNKAPEKSRIWLNLSDSKEIKAQILVGYLDGATNGFDYGIEGKNFADTPTNLSSVVENVDYAIQGRPLPFNSSDVVALNFKTTIEGSYSISIDHADGLFLTSQAVFLRDNLTGNVHNLKDTVYTFTSKVGTFSSRFELVYQKTLGTNDLTFNENSVVVYKQKNGNLLINSGNFIMDTIELYDISGRLIFSTKDINSSFKTISNLSISNQVLILKIKTAENGVINKKIIY